MCLCNVSTTLMISSVGVTGILTRLSQELKIEASFLNVKQSRKFRQDSIYDVFM